MAGKYDDRHDDDVSDFFVPMSVFYRGKKPKPVHAFEQLNAEQAERRHRQAERESKEANRDDDNDD